MNKMTFFFVDSLQWFERDEEPRRKFEKGSYPSPIDNLIRSFVF